MAQIEEIEMDAHRTQWKSDGGDLVDKYRAIFGCIFSRAQSS